MKTAFALVLVAAFVALFSSAAALYSNTNGEPKCTASNVQIGIFRNNFDPTRYWLCDSVGAAAKEVGCPNESGFLDSQKKCVSWTDWVWEQPNDPPTA
ncbi:uncharacterized protein LOC129954048 isoform X3 [Eupeodes corollae]|uniref:uncharacterized protein LOC129954048 isoform X2 n=1 Tax=Eupeodes corollae TaxID=290404 RepID=UPI002491587E|nr:uncharacterized protein LOC129954048 isoform X2 [Eupeodes corollae]XP_055923666.1 uncharacterized protein LOC129954048 isoform X3 [Eupeodes corollae]